MGTSIFVVETTDDDLLVGMLEFVEGGIVVRSGFVGHPKRIEAEDIVSLVPAEQHALIEYVKVG